jgi:hypothetical protein
MLEYFSDFDFRLLLQFSTRKRTDIKAFINKTQVYCHSLQSTSGMINALNDLHWHNFHDY